MSSLQDKVALITGGSRRLGGCTARTLHQHGMRLAIHYRSGADQAAALRAELCEKRPHSVRLLHGDLRQMHTLTSLVRDCIAEFGQLDALINNASAFHPTPLDTATEAQWQLLLDTNLKAPFFLAQAAAPHLKQSNGCIVNISDLYASRALAAHSIYTATKAALSSLTRSLALDLAPKIRVNAVAPGAILWPQHGIDAQTQHDMIAATPLKRLGDPTDIAKAIKFLLADADFITGHVLALDGGRAVVSP